MAPIELAQAINAMEKEELIRFNNVVHGYGFNAELMREKINEMIKYVTVNPAIFGEAAARSGIFEADGFDVLKEMYSDKTRPKPPLYCIAVWLLSRVSRTFFKTENRRNY